MGLDWRGKLSVLAPQHTTYPLAKSRVFMCELSFGGNINASA
jgi:hypothetical protein